LIRFAIVIVDCLTAICLGLMLAFFAAQGF